MIALLWKGRQRYSCFTGDIGAVRLVKAGRVSLGILICYFFITAIGLPGVFFGVMSAVFLGLIASSEFSKLQAWRVLYRGGLVMAIATTSASLLASYQQHLGSLFVIFCLFFVFYLGRFGSYWVTIAKLSSATIILGGMFPHTIQDGIFAFVDISIGFIVAALLHFFIFSYKEEWVLFSGLGVGFYHLADYLTLLIDPKKNKEPKILLVYAKKQHTKVTATFKETETLIRHMEGVTPGLTAYERHSKLLLIQEQLLSNCLITMDAYRNFCLLCSGPTLRLYLESVITIMRDLLHDLNHSIFYLDSSEAMEDLRMNKEMGHLTTVRTELQTVICNHLHQSSNVEEAMCLFNFLLAIRDFDLNVKNAFLETWKLRKSLS